MQLNILKFDKKIKPFQGLQRFFVYSTVKLPGLRKKHPELNRPYKAPGILIGAPISAIIYIIMMTQLDSEAFWTGVIWCILGLVIYLAVSQLIVDIS